MMDAIKDQIVDRVEIAEFVNNHIASALANHLGGAEVVSVEEGHVRLRMTASCGTCYFRRGCIDNLVVPTFQEKFGTRFKLTVR